MLSARFSYDSEFICKDCQGSFFSRKTNRDDFGHYRQVEHDYVSPIFDEIRCSDDFAFKMSKESEHMSIYT